MSQEAQKINADVGYLDIEIAQGADTDINIEYKVGGVVLDLSSYSATLQVRRNYGSTVLLELSTADPGIDMSASSPNIVLHFSSSDTAAMTIYKNMIYDLEITSPAARVTKVLRGKFDLVREVTT